MTIFSQQNRKLQKIFNDIKKNTSTLESRRNEQLLLTFFKTNISPHFIIEDTDWIAKAPDTNTGKTINKGDLLPASLSINYSTEIGIPDFLLPYIDVEVLIKTPPDSTLITYDKFSTENYTGNYINVQGVEGLIYNGIYPTPLFVSFTDLGTVVPEANTKKVWRVTVLHNTGGDEFVTTGELLQISTTENTETCERDPGGTITINDQFYCSPFSTAPHKILDFDDEGFTGIGDFTDNEFISGPPDCDTSSTEEEGVELSKNFSAIENYELYLSGSQTNITQETTSPGTFFVQGNDITSYESIIFNGYRPYYSSSTQKEFQTSGTADIILVNPPNSSITLKRNLESLSSILDTNIFENVLLQRGGNRIRKDIAFFKIQDENTNNFPFYYLKIGIGATILAPAIVNTSNPGIITQSDIYINSSRTSTTRGSVYEAYFAKKQDVQYRLMIIIKNPFWYQEVRKYVTSEQFE